MSLAYFSTYSFVEESKTGNIWSLVHFIVLSGIPPIENIIKSSVFLFLTLAGCYFLVSGLKT